MLSPSQSCSTQRYRRRKPDDDRRLIDELRRWCQRWLQHAAVRTLYIHKASPWENGYVESSNGKLRGERLNRELFLSVPEARYVLDEWRVEHNHRQPHSGLGRQTPAAYAANFVDQQAGAFTDRTFQDFVANAVQRNIYEPQISQMSRRTLAREANLEQCYFRRRQRPARSNAPPTTSVIALANDPGSISGTLEGVACAGLPNAVKTNRPPQSVKAMRELIEPSLFANRIVITSPKNGALREESLIHNRSYYLHESNN